MEIAHFVYIVSSRAQVHTVEPHISTINIESDKLPLSDLMSAGIVMIARPLLHITIINRKFCPVFGKARCIVCACVRTTINPIQIPYIHRFHPACPVNGECFVCFFIALQRRGVCTCGSLLASTRHVLGPRPPSLLRPSFIRIWSRLVREHIILASIHCVLHIVRSCHACTRGASLCSARMQMKSI